MHFDLKPYFAKDTPPQDAIRIQQSWQRCADLDLKLLTDPNPLSKSNLNYKREANQKLIEISATSLNILGTLACSLNSVVVLADADGLILHELGSNTFQDTSHRIALQAGVSWSEQMRGTNAIGTALHDRRAVRIHGSEHFLKHNNILSCHAAPIFSATGEILGVLDISGPAAEIHPRALTIVQRIAQEISNQLIDASPYDQLEFSQNDNRRAILLLDDAACIRGANETALNILGANWQIIGSHYSKWLDGKLNINNTRLRDLSGNLIIGNIKQKPKTYRSSPKPHTISLDAHSNHLAQQAINGINHGLSILLQGETGAGKEVMARHIYTHSKWHSGNFVAINCAALPEHLIESELFGYEPGAFTGAKKDGYRGLLHQANNGILFLDEIGDMPMALQARLLRVLQEREVQPLGSEKRIALKFGLISASNQDLKSMVDRGLFRADLYYRLQDMPVYLPALRQRADLSQYLQQAFNDHGLALEQPACDYLVQYHWPGNYRELFSIIRRLSCQYPGEIIQKYMLPVDMLAVSVTDNALPPAQVQANTDLRTLEQQAIQQAIDKFNGNITQAAKHLGIHRSTLYRKLNS